jgi:hypothetical protein
VRLFIQVIHPQSSPGEGWTDGEINEQLAILAADFESHRIRFVVVGRSDIYNDSFWTAPHFNMTAIYNTNRHADAIDVYLGNPAVGFARAETFFSTALILAGWPQTSVLTEEVGHCLGLYHTFETAICVEDPPGPGSNCAECGDLICDTPKDPFQSGLCDYCLDENCGYTNPICQQLWTPGWEPDVLNYMAYTCVECKQRFTAEQRARMLAALEYMEVLQPIREIREDIEFPNGGERLVDGATARIEWTGEQSSQIDAVTVLFSEDGGQNYTTVAADIVNLGWYDWTPSLGHGTTQGVIKVVFHNTQGVPSSEDVSDAPFTIAASSPVTYENKTTESQINYSTAHPYSSVAFDYSGDDAPDIFISMKNAGGRLYKRGYVSQSGDAQFVDRTFYDFADGSEPPVSLRGLAVANYDNWSRNDFFAAHTSAPQLYRWNPSLGPTGQFENVAGDTYVDGSAVNSWAGVWGDYNGDGWVDLFVSRALNEGEDPTPETIAPDDPDDVLLMSQILENGFFVSGATPPSEYPSAALAAAWADINGDRRLDLFIGDLRADGVPATSSKMYISQGDGTFVDEFATRFTANEVNEVTSAEWADMNLDGAPDLVLGNGTNDVWVFMNHGDGSFTGEPVRLQVGGPTTGVEVFDADLDGWPDLLCLPRDSGQSVRLFLNSRSTAGCRVSDVTAVSGLSGFTGRVDGAAVASYDDDQVPDLYLGKQMSTGAVYFKGTLGSPGSHYVGLRLYGYMNNAASIGAEATFSVGERAISHWVDGGSGRGGQRDLTLICGIGEETGSVQAEITWPDGFRRTVSIPADSVLVACDGGAEPEIPLASVTATYQTRPEGGESVADWIFTWDTTYRSDSDKDLVTIVDAPGSPGYCLLNQTVELRPGDPGVEATLTAKVGGGYEHRIVWKDRPCVPGCTYNYKVACGTECDESAPMANWKQLRIRVCAQ